MANKKNVLIALEMNEASGRKQLSGILRYLEKSVHWNIRLLQYARNLTTDMFRELEANHFDGLLSGINAGDSNIATQRILAAYPAPAVFMDAEPLSPAIRGTHMRTFIRIDNADVGRSAAKHLISLGSFRSFAFLPERANPHWSTIRMRTFCKELKRKGRTCLTFESYAPDETRYRTDLAAWLTSLPKPAALFCAWDSCAITAATVCSECRISIPEQISILGVDDDEFLCNLVSPPLSSIRPDFEGEGFLAAKMLDQMMNSKGMTRPKLMSCKVDGVTERGSTHPLSPSGFLVQRALDFIDDNVCRGITVPDVVDHLGVSRSLLSLRFRQIQRESILQTIRTRRMREVKRLLSSTAYPIARIISMCGFRSESRPKNLFRKMFGMTMSEYRRRHHAETAKHTFR